MQLKFALISCAIVAALFFGMLALLEAGRRLRRRRTIVDSGAGAGAIDGAVFALLGLLLALMFNSAGQRFDARRHLVVQETNAIGTAFLRLDLLPADAQPPLRDRFRRYVDSRLEIYRVLDLEGSHSGTAAYAVLQREIWNLSVEATRREGVPVSTADLLIPALNDMIDITTTRTAATLIHVPGLIFAFLISLALSSAFLAGYGLAVTETRNWVHLISFAAAVSVTVYVIIDLEYPRLGLIQVNAFDRLLVELRAGMG